MELQLDLCRRLVREGEDFALVTLLSSDGSSPRGPGAKMLVTRDSIDATIGGGSLELRAVELARDAIERKRPLRVRIDLTGKSKDSVDMVCGGAVNLLITYVDASSEDAELLFECLAARQECKEPCKWLTAVSGEGEQTRVWQAVQLDGRLVGSLPGWAQPLPDGDDLAEYRLHDRGEGRLLLSESVGATVHIYLCGGGHVGLQTARLARFCGYDVTVYDDRPEFVDEDRFPWAERVLTSDYQGMFEDVPVGKGDCIVIMTRGHRFDADILKEAVKTEAGYVGMIGSRRKVALAKKELAQEGVEPSVIEGIHTPIGVSIGAETPAEIAISIIAEIVKYTRLDA